MFKAIREDHDSSRSWNMLYPGPDCESETRGLRVSLAYTLH